MLNLICGTLCNWYVRKPVLMWERAPLLRRTLIDISVIVRFEPRQLTEVSQPSLHWAAKALLHCSFISLVALKCDYVGISVQGHASGRQPLLLPTVQSRISLDLGYLCNKVCFLNLSTVRRRYFLHVISFQTIHILAFISVSVKRFFLSFAYDGKYCNWVNKPKN